jgi:hypothetical protein
MQRLRHELSAPARPCHLGRLARPVVPDGVDSGTSPSDTASTAASPKAGDSQNGVQEPSPVLISFVQDARGSSQPMQSPMRHQFVTAGPGGYPSERQLAA